MKEQDEIEQLFSSSFDGFEKAPPADVKAAIDASLFSGSAATESKKRKGIIWWFALALVIGLTGLGSVIYLSNKSEESNVNNSIAKNSVSEGNSKDQTSENFKKDQKDQTSKSINQTQNLISNSSSTATEVKKPLSSNAKTQVASTASSSQNYKKQTKTKKTKSTFQKQPILTDNESPLKKNNPNLTAGTSTKMMEDEPSNIQLDPYFDMKAKEDETSNTIKESSADLSSTETKIDSSGITDSSTANILTTNNPTGTNTPLSKTSPFSLTIYGGTTYGFSSLQQPSSSSFKMKESIGFSSSIEMNYVLNNRFGVGAGLDMNSRMDNFYRIEQLTDSIFIGLVPQYVYDPQVPDSILDTLYLEEYDVTNHEIEQSQLIRHTSFALPLTFNWNIYSKGRWNYRLGSIVRLAYVNNKLVSNDHNFDVPEFKKFSVRIGLRPQVDYTFNKIAIGAYLNCGYDLLPSVNWTDIERKRVDLGAGLLLRYKF